MDTDRQPSAVFVADAHFHLNPDAAEQGRVLRFLELLEWSRQADHLVLLGDIFDFWFDYPHFRLRGYEPLLQGLDGVRAAGTRIHFVGGNHDIWAASYLHDRYGTEPGGLAMTLPVGGVRVRLEHGDGLLEFDRLYSLFRFLVRTGPGIFLAKSLHPEVLYVLSTWLSGRSRKIPRDKAARIQRKAAAWLAAQGEQPWDLMLIGHIHHRFEVAVGERRLAALGGWLDRLDYGVLQGGRFSILDFQRDPPPRL